MTTAAISPLRQDPVWPVVLGVTCLHVLAAAIWIESLPVQQKTMPQPGVSIEVSLVESRSEAQQSALPVSQPLSKKDTTSAKSSRHSTATSSAFKEESRPQPPSKLDGEEAVQRHIKSSSVATAEPTDATQPQSAASTSAGSNLDKPVLASSNIATSSAAVGAQSTTVTDDATLRYLAELMARLRRAKVYPTELRKEKVEGLVVVTFTVNAKGWIVQSAVKKSSGHSGLDAAALSALSRANPLPAIPAAVNREQISLSMPLEYSLITDR